ncbi:MAG: LysM peptidoglycan-binding domain-containing protein [Yoonia sp.]
MIRSVVALFVFSVLLCGYIVLRPADVAPAQPVGADDLAVTRAQTDTILAPVTKTAELTNAAVIQAPQRTTAPGALVATTDAGMDSTAANVLAGLGLNTAQDTSPTGADPMLEMTTGILSGIGALTGETITAGPQTPEPESDLEPLVVKALQEGKNDAYIDAMVNEAANAGTIRVPKILVTSEGRVDTHVLLTSIVTKAKIAAGGEAPAVPERPEGVEVRVVQRATESQQYRFYTVKRGDSLGAIAVNFFGNVDKYKLIYDANRSTLSSPNELRIGQRLTIPDV